MQWGEFELTTVSGGRFRTDGGAMYGVVPRSLWQRITPPADDNTIAQSTNCLLVQHGSQRVLIDTGYGPKLSEKQRHVFQSEEGAPLITSLAGYGVEPSDIDLVILTHLHFDHAGGGTSLDDAGKTVPTFPNARYVVQRGEWETAVAEIPELRGAYPIENLLPLQEHGQLELIEGDIEILPGIRSRVTPGHTQWHQSILIDNGDGRQAVYLGDLCPSHAHLKTLWCMGFDIHMLEVRRQKRKLLAEAADGEWLVLFDHDSQAVAAFVERHPHHDFVAGRMLTSLDELG